MKASGRRDSELLEKAQRQRSAVHYKLERWQARVRSLRRWARSFATEPYSLKVFTASAAQRLAEERGLPQVFGQRDYRSLHLS